jgi:non-canonical purine NTP pyrophosphatase (RdgB/HAM1 family)
MKPKLFIVTGNKMKFEELSLGLSLLFNCEQKVLHEPEIQGTPEEIIKHKLISAYKIFGGSVFVDDTSVHLAELNGFPGPYMKDFWKCFTPEEMGKKFAGTRMKVVNHVGLCRGEDHFIFTEGVIEGDIIAPTHNNHNGREFDLFMKVDGTNKVMLDYTIEEKNEFSHRGLAMKNLLEILAKENIN